MDFASLTRSRWVLRIAGPLLAAALPWAAVAQTPTRSTARVLPIAEPKRPVYTEIDARKVKTPPRFEVKAPAGAPNVVIVLIDDLGFGVPSSFGGPVADADARQAGPAAACATTTSTPPRCARRRAPR